MTDSFDVAAGHEFFAASCFNEVWAILDDDGRTAEDVETMVDLAHASRMHWRHRDDRLARQESISAWQLSRVYAIADRPDEALRYGTEALDIARASETGAFYVGYGHEAVARAALALGDMDTASLHIKAAVELLDVISDPDERDALSRELDGLANDE